MLVCNDINCMFKFKKERFSDRQEAGKQLAITLKNLKIKADLILAIPRGGLVVGAEIAKVLDCPLDVLITKKLSAPGNPELAIGALGPDGAKFLDKHLVKITGADKSYLNQEIKDKGKEILRRTAKYRGKREDLYVSGKIVILTDDGVATGATVRAAIKWLRNKGVKKLVLVLPVCARDTAKELKKLVDDFICLLTPQVFFAVGQFYDSFEQTSDEEVIDLLQKEASQ